MEKFLIWSAEKRLWWGPNSMGYTEDVIRAGQYSEKEAMEICNAANHHLPIDKPPNELLIPADLAYSLFQERKQHEI